jgi:hypothetical protein
MLKLVRVAEMLDGASQIENKYKLKKKEIYDEARL